MAKWWQNGIMLGEDGDLEKALDSGSTDYDRWSPLHDYLT
jgi:hypothetical protein